MRVIRLGMLQHKLSVESCLCPLDVRKMRTGVVNLLVECLPPHMIFITYPQDISNGRFEFGKLKRRAHQINID